MKDDSISRKTAMDIAKDLLIPMDEYHQYNQAINNYSAELAKLPSAEPDRNEGEWVPAFNGKYVGGAYWFSCSECKRIVPDVRNGGWNFCPSCGARTR